MVAIYIEKGGANWQSRLEMKRMNVFLRFFFSLSSLHKVKDAGDMDHLIAAHEEFLETIIKRSLLDDKSANILAQLRLLLDQIIKFQNIQVSEESSLRKNAVYD